MQDTLRLILDEFGGLCAIPHASRHEQAISAYLMGRLRELTERVRQDEYGNLLAEFPASEGLEQAPTVILQAHMDMVLAGNVPPEKAVVHTVERDGVLYSDGKTTLGADNGIGLAVILALVQNKSLRHGPLRVLFTVREETGLEGARGLSEDWLQGARYLINTDGFHADTELIGCKGGLRETISSAIIRRRTPEGSEACRIRLSGFLGGHSGDDIDSGRVNTIISLAAILKAVQRETDLSLAELSGGNGFNVIPAWAQALVVIPKGSREKLRRAVRESAERVLAPYRDTDGEGTVSLEDAELPPACYEESFQKRTVNLLLKLHNGVCVRDASGTVLSSCNLGMVREERNGILDLCDMLRCDTVKMENDLLAQHQRVLNDAGYGVSVKGYHSWHSRADNPLAEAVSRVYERLTGEKIKRKVALVGVEPALFHEKDRELEIVCLAAEIHNAHSVEENVRLDTVLRLYLVMEGVLPLLAQETA